MLIGDTSVGDCVAMVIGRLNIGTDGFTIEVGSEVRWAEGGIVGNVAKVGIAGTNDVVGGLVSGKTWTGDTAVGNCVTIVIGRLNMGTDDTLVEVGSKVGWIEDGITGNVVVVGTDVGIVYDDVVGEIDIGTMVVGATSVGNIVKILIGRLLIGTNGFIIEVGSSVGWAGFFGDGAVVGNDENNDVGVGDMADGKILADSVDGYFDTAVGTNDNSVIKMVGVVVFATVGTEDTDVGHYNKDKGSIVGNVDIVVGVNDNDDGIVVVVDGCIVGFKLMVVGKTDDGTLVFVVVSVVLPVNNDTNDSK